MAEIKLNNPKDGCLYVYDTEGTILGEGGMGIVYLGTRIDANGIETKVAIKKLKIKDAEVVERARREANIQLNNDNLVRMYGMIEVEDKDEHFNSANYYVLSEYLEGVMLNDVLAGKLENRAGEVYPYVQELYDQYSNQRNETATYIVKCVLSGVMALHDAGYIHRDIDPSNIMVTADGKIKLIDFGIAKKLAGLANEPRLTTPGQFMGKAEYAAPEQILGDTAHQNYATDVYSIGILYYELVVGGIPFDGSRYEIIESQQKKKLPLKKISSWQIREVIGKATEKKNTERYATAVLFRAAIDNMVFPEKKKVNWTLIGGVAAAVLILAIGGWWWSRPAPSPVPEPIPQPTKEELLAKYNAMLDSGIRDTAQVGLKSLEKLADDSVYVDAMYEVAALYAAVQSGYSEILNKRKNLLGLNLDFSDGQQNIEAVRWLNKTIEKSDSTNYKALYLIATYYYAGKVVNEDKNKAKQLCNLSLDLAKRQRDVSFADLVQKTLNSF